MEEGEGGKRGREEEEGEGGEEERGTLMSGTIERLYNPAMAKLSIHVTTKCTQLWQLYVPSMVSVIDWENSPAPTLVTAWI